MWWCDGETIVKALLVGQKERRTVVKRRLMNKFAAFALSALLAISPASLLFAQSGSKTNTSEGTLDGTVGVFTVKVPSAWRRFSTSESEQLQRQVVVQNKEIYRQYFGVTKDPAIAVNIDAFNIEGNAGSFAIVSFTIPPQSDHINVLRNQAEEKAKWGVEQGYIHKFLDLVPIDDEQFSGFYIKTIGRNGEVQVSGVLEHKRLKNTLIQLTLLCPKAWDEGKATSTLSSVLKTLMLKEKSKALRDNKVLGDIFGDFESDSQRRIDSDAFKHALQLNTPDVFTKYLDRPFPNFHLSDAYQSLQKLDNDSYVKARKEKTISGWNRYLTYFPNGEWTTARTILEKIDTEAYSKALEKNSWPRIIKYLYEAVFGPSLINYLNEAVLNPYSTKKIEAFKKLAEFNDPKVIPEIVTLLPKLKIGSLIEVVSILESLNWSPNTPQDKVLYLAGKGEWEKIPLIGDQAIQPLIMLLGVGERRDWRQRYYSTDLITIIKILGEIGSNNALIPLVLEARENSEAEIRHAALQVLIKNFNWAKIDFKKPIISAKYPDKVRSSPFEKSKRWEWTIRLEETNGIGVILYQRRVLLTTSAGNTFSSNPVGSEESIEHLYFNAYGTNQYSYWVAGSNFISCSIDFIGADIFGNEVEFTTQVLLE